MLRIQKQAEQYEQAEEARDQARAERDPVIETFNVPTPPPAMTADP